MIKIGKDISSFSTYSCQPKTKKELDGIIISRIEKEGPNCDLNDIDVSLVEDMAYLFAQSKFNGNISKWNVSKVKYTFGMFGNSKFNKPIGNWNVINVENMAMMFAFSKFNQDISKWKINKECNTSDMFEDCPIKEEFKPKLK